MQEQGKFVVKISMEIFKNLPKVDLKKYKLRPLALEILLAKTTGTAWSIENNLTLKLK